jgi:hypothetical protein
VNGQSHAFEHLVRGGIWFGAQARDASGAFTGVVTGTTDGNQGSSGQSATEWTPIGRSILLRSTLQTSPGDPINAVSEEDLVAQYDDRVARTPAQNTEINRPMGVQVTQESYSWSFAEYTHSVIFHVSFKNTGPVMQNAWLGFYSELASGDKSLYTSRNLWPPTTTGSPVGGWYNKKWIAYEVRSGCIASTTAPGSRFEQLQPHGRAYWVGIRILGLARADGRYDDEEDHRVALELVADQPRAGVRHAAIHAHERGHRDAGGRGQPAAGDRRPRGTDGGRSVPDRVSRQHRHVRLRTGRRRRDRRPRAALAPAQRAYDRGYIIPIPPPPPRFKAVAHDNSIDYFWDSSAELAFDKTSAVPHDFEGYRIYVGDEPLALRWSTRLQIAPGARRVQHRLEPSGSRHP